MENQYHERWQRSLVKAITYRVVIVLLDFGAVFFLTKRIEVAIGFVVASNIYTTVAYFFHERIWNGVRWGTKGI